MSMNINIGPQYGHGTSGMLPGLGMPGFGGGMNPGINLQIGAGDSCCEGKKKKKDRGIIGDLLTGLFGEDSCIGKLLDRDKKCCRKRGRCGHRRGGVNININTNQRASAFGF